MSGNVSRLLGGGAWILLLLRVENQDLGLKVLAFTIFHSSPPVPEQELCHTGVPE